MHGLFETRPHLDVTKDGSAFGATLVAKRSRGAADIFANNWKLWTYITVRFKWTCIEVRAFYKNKGRLLYYAFAVPTADFWHCHFLSPALSLSRFII
jgi:hypothetical protein